MQTMSSSSLANWDGSQTRRNSKQPFGNSDVRTLSFGGPLASTSTETSNNNHTAAYFDASLTRTEDHQASWRTAEGNNQDVSSMARVFSLLFLFAVFFFFFPFSFFLSFFAIRLSGWTRVEFFSPFQTTVGTTISTTMPHLATSVDVSGGFLFFRAQVAFNVPLLDIHGHN